MSPVVRPIFDRFLNGGLVLAAIMEDLPYLDNRVLPSDRPSTDGRQRLRLRYRLHAGEVERRAVFLRQVKEVLKPFRKLTLRTGENNSTLGHVCGTCRFGTDPKYNPTNSPTFVGYVPFFRSSQTNWDWTFENVQFVWDHGAGAMAPPMEEPLS